MLQGDGEPLIPIPIDSFLSGSTSQVNIYIKISEEKAVKVVKEGQPFDLERLRNYQDHNVEELFIPKSTYGTYLNGCLAIVNILSEHDKCSSEVIVRTAESVLTEIFEIDFTKDSFGHLLEVAGAMVQGLKKTPGIEALLHLIESIDSEVYRHSVAVSYIATLIGFKMGWKGTKTLRLLSTGGFLHDIGFKNLDMSLAKKPVSMMTEDELKIYHEHPEEGAKEIMKVAPGNEELMEIVLEHHENTHGKGFPRKLSKREILPLATIVAMSDQLAKIIIRSSYNPIPKEPKSALSYFELKESAEYPQEYWQALHRMID